MDVGQVGGCRATRVDDDHLASRVVGDRLEDAFVGHSPGLRHHPAGAPVQCHGLDALQVVLRRRQLEQTLRRLLARYVVQHSRQACCAQLAGVETVGEGDLLGELRDAQHVCVALGRQAHPDPVAVRRQARTTAWADRR